MGLIQSTKAPKVLWGGEEVARKVGTGVEVRAKWERSPEIGNLLPNNRRQRRTCYALCHLLYPVSAAQASILRMDSNSTSYHINECTPTEPGVMVRICQRWSGKDLVHSRADVMAVQRCLEAPGPLRGGEARFNKLTHTTAVWS